MAYTGPGYPKWLATEYPGLEGINTAMGGFNYLLNDPGFKQLAMSQAADPSANQYQSEVVAGIPPNAAAGAFGRVLAGNMGADVAGQAAQNQGQESAQKARIGLGQDAASLMAGQQGSELDVEKAQTEQATQELGGFSGILNALTNPKGLGANIMGLFTGGNSTSPLGGLFSKIGSLFGSGSNLFGGADLLGSGVDAGSGIGDLTAALGSSQGAGGLSDLFATIMETLPAAAAA